MRDIERELMQVRSAARAGNLDRVRAGLDSSHLEVRGMALEALAAAKVADLPRLCAERLSDRSERVRVTAVKLLRRDGAAPWLEARFADPEVGPWAAAAALGSPAARAALQAHPDCVDLLIQALKTPARPHIRERAMAVLKSDAQAPVRLVAALETRNERARRLFADVLSDGKPSDALLTGLDDAVRAPWCAAALAATLTGRKAMAEREDQCYGPLTAAVVDTRIQVRLRVYTSRALAVCRRPEAGDALAAAARGASTLLRSACEEALYVRGDWRSVPMVLRRIEDNPYWRDAESALRWLGETQDNRALPLLRKLTSPWRALLVPGNVRAAARVALEQVLATTAGVPDGAIGLAPVMDEPTERAISLWQDETPVVADDEPS